MNKQGGSWFSRIIIFTVMYICYMMLSLDEALFSFSSLYTMHRKQSAKPKENLLINLSTLAIRYRPPKRKFCSEMISKFQGNLTTESVLNELVTPESPYLLAKYCMVSGDVRGGSIALTNMISRCPMLDHNVLNQVRDLDIIVVDPTMFVNFVTEYLHKLHCRVILFTCRWHIPQVERSEYTDLLLNHSRIAHWYSQNPIYDGHPKYTAFPYGVARFMQLATAMTKNAIPKKVHLGYLYFKIEHHYERALLPPAPALLNLADFYTEIMASKFIISPHGDRPDCYRHYEAIALGAIPISNVPQSFRQIFGDDMIISNVNDMSAYVLGTKTINVSYHKPSCEILSLAYWRSKIEHLRHTLLEKNSLLNIS